MLYQLLLQTAGGPEQRLYEYGVIGIAVVVLAGVCYRMFKIILNDRDKAIQQRDDLLDTYFTKVLPAIVENTKLLESRQALDQEIILVLRDNNRLLSRMDRGGP